MFTDYSKVVKLFGGRKFLFTQKSRHDFVLRFFRRRNFRGFRGFCLNPRKFFLRKNSLWLIRVSLCPNYFKFGHLQKFYPWKKKCFKIGPFQQYLYKISNICPLIQKKKKQESHCLRENCRSEMNNYVVDPLKFLYAKRIKKAHPRTFLCLKYTLIFRLRRHFTKYEILYLGTLYHVTTRKKSAFRRFFVSKLSNAMCDNLLMQGTKPKVHFLYFTGRNFRTFQNFRVSRMLIEVLYRQGVSSIQLC